MGFRGAWPGFREVWPTPAVAVNRSGPVIDCRVMRVERRCHARDQALQKSMATRFAPLSNHAHASTPR